MHITYITSEEQKHRDNKFHNEKYLKERIKNEFEFSGLERMK